MSTKYDVLSDLADYFDSIGKILTVQEYAADVNKPMTLHMVRRWWNYPRLTYQISRVYPTLVIGGEPVARAVTVKAVSLTGKIPTSSHI